MIRATVIAMLFSTVGCSNGRTPSVPDHSAAGGRGTDSSGIDGASRARDSAESVRTSGEPASDGSGGTSADGPGGTSGNAGGALVSDGGGTPDAVTAVAPTNPVMPGADGVIIDADFTKMPLPKGVIVKGGMFADGFKQIAAGDRIILDAGYKIKKGYAEVTLVADAHPLMTTAKDKAVFFGVWEDDKGTNSFSHYNAGDKGYVRFRTEPGRNYFLEMKGFDRPFDTTEGDWRPCCSSDWTTLIGKPVTLRFTWGTSGLVYTGPKGPHTKTGMFDAIRFGVIGADTQYDALIKGFRYLRAKIVDLEAPGASVAASTK